MSGQQKWFEFEREVVDLYRVLGARVIHNSIINGSQIDILLENAISGAVPSVRTIVECKAFARPVGIDTVNAFAIVFTNLRHTGNVDQGVMVSQSGFTARAKSAAKASGIHLVEIEELRHLAKTALPVPDATPDVEDVKPDKKYVFVLMPFDEEFENVYWFGIRGAVEDAGLYCQRADELHFTGNVLDKINEEIRRADILVADMTERNPNVFYEVGIAHTIEKPTVLLVQSVDDIPFDLRTHNHIVYNPRKIKEFKEQLSDVLKAIVK